MTEESRQKKVVRGKWTEGCGPRKVNRGKWAGEIGQRLCSQESGQRKVDRVRLSEGSCYREVIRAKWADGSRHSTASICLLLPLLLTMTLNIKQTNTELNLFHNKMGSFAHCQIDFHKI